MALAATAAGTAIAAGIAFYKKLENNGEVIIRNMSDQFVMSHGHRVDAGDICDDAGTLDGAAPVGIAEGMLQPVYFTAVVAVTGKLAPKMAMFWQLFPSRTYLTVIPWLSGTKTPNKGFFGLSPELPDMDRIINHAKEHVIDHSDVHNVVSRNRGIQATGSLNNEIPSIFEITLQNI